MNSIKKIGLITGTLNSGGAERMMVNLAKNFAGHQIQVIFFLVNKTGPFLKELPGHITVVDLKAPAGVKSAVFSLRREIKNHRPQVLISTQPHINVIVNAALKCFKHRPVVILREASTPTFDFQNRSFFTKQIYKAGYLGADHYVAVSEGVKKDMGRFYGIQADRITAIYNPVIDKFFFQKLQEDVSHRWLQDESVPVITAVGRMVPHKDYLTLLQAFAQLRKKCNARLIILGDTSQNVDYTSHVHRFIQENSLDNVVDIAGFTANPFPVLRRSSLFVMSSKYEGLPGSLIQALACGCAVVCTDCPSGPAEILENGKYGKLVPVGDAEALAQAMLQSLREEHDKDVLKKRAGDFSAEKSGKEYLNLINKLLSN